MEEILKSFPSARITPSSSGCAETDAMFSPFNVFVTGTSNIAEKECDALQEEFSLQGLNVSRTGPRNLYVSAFIKVTQYSDETVSF